MMETTGPILVTGGCGFLGYHVVQALLKDPSAGPIFVVSRRPRINLFPQVKYIEGDIADAAFTDRTIQETKPSIIIHTASPRLMDESAQEHTFFEVNVNGTRNLIEAAKRSSTRVFVFSSTVNVIQGDEHINVVEDALPYWQRDSKAIAYWRSKAEAEALVLGANSDQLKTVALRPCLMVGIQEHALIPAQLDALAQKKTNIQLGNNTNLLDVVGAEDAARAHLLAVHALLDPSKAKGKVDGEGFNITGDHPLPFWNISRIIWRTAGDTTGPNDVKVIPAWMATAMASIAEIAYGFFFWGNKTPELNRQVVNFCTRTYTYNMEKAKTVLGYRPVQDVEQVIREATLWEMQQRLDNHQEEEKK